MNLDSLQVTGKHTGTYNVLFDPTFKNIEVDIIRETGLPWENDFLEVFGELLMRNRRDGVKSVVIDVGAGIGSFLQYACHTDPGVVGWAFEPISRNIPALTRNLAGYTCTIMQGALGDVNTRMVFVVSGFNVGVSRLIPSDIMTADEMHAYIKRVDNLNVGEDLPVVDALTAIKLTCSTGASNELEVVNMRRFDDYWTNYPDCKVYVKLDVEGYEVQVIRGMSEFIRKHKPLIMAEANSSRESLAIETALHAINPGYTMTFGMHTAKQSPSNVMAFYEVD